MINYVISNQPEAVCDFSSVNAALEHLPWNPKEPVTLLIRAGIYHELITVSRPNITFQGDGAGKTILSYDRYALQKMEDGTKRGTFRTQTLFLDACNLTLRDLTVENTAGSGRTHGQALAVYADGDCIVFENCHLLGNQDTLFTGPLPPTPYQLGGFTGPKEFSPRINGRQLYKNCLIRGSIDFIFGSATAYFEDCEIFSQKDVLVPSAQPEEAPKIHGYVTAASTPEGQTYGYVFNRCRLTGDCPPASCYLGRPWRSFAKTVYLNCTLGAHIHPEGWNDWNKSDAQDTIYYAEYNSTGPGAEGIREGLRASFSRQLNDKQAELFRRENVLGY